MRHLISTIAAVALASAVGVFAQEQQAPAQGPASSNEQAQKSTVTGCVVQAKTTAGERPRGNTFGRSVEAEIICFLPHVYFIRSERDKVSTWNVRR